MKTSSQRTSALVRSVVGGLVVAAGTTAAHAQCSGFQVTSLSGNSIVPGVTDTGNRGDDVTTALTLPFSVTFYGNSYSQVTVSSNGNLQFGGTSGAYTNDCLGNSTQITGPAIFALWDDLRTDGTGGGVFTSVSGSAPNRVFNIEWRATYFGNGQALNFEARLFEDNSRIEVVYGTVPDSGASATSGIQSTAGTYAQFSCNTATLTNGLKVTYSPVNPTTTLCPTAGFNPAGVTNCQGASSTLSVTVNPAQSPTSTGIAVTANMTSLGGSATQALYDDGTHGDAVAGDNVFSFQVSIPASVTPGSKSVSYSASDQQGRTGAGTASIVVNCVTPPNPTLGPDVVTYDLPDITRWGTNTTVDAGRPVGSVAAFSVGTTSSNLGDYPVLWVDGSPSYAPDYNNTQQPAISQNMYRLKDYGGYKRFEQVGQSWLKHGFVSTNSGGGPGTCQPNTQVWRYSTQSYQNFGGDALGINCTDTYGSGLNGSQGNLGPKNIVNATTGFSPYTLGSGTGDATIRERLQVAVADTTGQPAGTRYFVDAYYCTQDDAQFVRPGQTVAINSLNNASWRELTAASINTTPAFSGGTQRYNPGIYAWRAADATVTLVTVDHDDFPNPGTGWRNPDGSQANIGTTIRSRYVVAGKATSIGGGLYRYEYAVYNHNSDRSGGSFSVPLPPGATVSDVAFHAPTWHSGEPYSNAPWTADRTSNALTFSTQPYSVNQNANALRWANMFNFGFTTNVAPTNGDTTIGLFKPGAVPGAPVSVTASAVPVPTLGAQCTAADIGSQGGLLGNDGVLDNNDFIVLIDRFFAADSRADFGRQGGLVGSDGQFDNNDFIAFIGLFFQGCN
ncbi:MAG: hypothetical protein K2Q09_06980 [Phycisphaerales bacterium]|nr:hypothetical protein [Phycisphaerales bacterium]